MDTTDGYTLRNAADEIVGTFATEREAIEHGSHLADADPDECYSVVRIVPIVSKTPRRTFGTVTVRPRA